MEYSKIFCSENSDNSVDLVTIFKNASAKVLGLNAEQYNKLLFQDMSNGFEILVGAMQNSQEEAFSLFLLWFEVFLHLKDRIELYASYLKNKYEKIIPNCFYCILISLQFKPEVEHYHQRLLGMALTLLKNISEKTLKRVAHSEISNENALLVVMTSVGDFNIQLMAMRLLVKLLKFYDVENISMCSLDIAELSQLRRSIYLLAPMVDYNEEKIDNKARTILNAFNMKPGTSCLVFSLWCKSFVLGKQKFLKKTDAEHFWIDFNYEYNTMTCNCQHQNFPNSFFITIKVGGVELKNYTLIVNFNQQATISAKISMEKEFDIDNVRKAVIELDVSEVNRLKENDWFIMYYTDKSKRLNNVEDKDALSVVGHEQAGMVFKKQSSQYIGISISTDTIKTRKKSEKKRLSRKSSHLTKSTSCIERVGSPVSITNSDTDTDSTEFNDLDAIEFPAKIAKKYTTETIRKFIASIISETTLTSRKTVKTSTIVKNRLLNSSRSSSASKNSRGRYVVSINSSCKGRKKFKPKKCNLKSFGNEQGRQRGGGAQFKLKSKTSLYSNKPKKPRSLPNNKNVEAKSFICNDTNMNQDHAEASVSYRCLETIGQETFGRECKRKKLPKRAFSKVMPIDYANVKNPKSKNIDYCLAQLSMFNPPAIPFKLSISSVQCPVSCVEVNSFNSFTNTNQMPVETRNTVTTGCTCDCCRCNSSRGGQDDWEPPLSIIDLTNIPTSYNTFGRSWCDTSQSSPALDYKRENENLVENYCANFLPYEEESSPSSISMRNSAKLNLDEECGTCSFKSLSDKNDNCDENAKDLQNQNDIIASCSCSAISNKSELDDTFVLETVEDQSVMQPIQIVEGFSHLITKYQKEMISRLQEIRSASNKNRDDTVVEKVKCLAKMSITSIEEEKSLLKNDMEKISGLINSLEEIFESYEDRKERFTSNQIEIQSQIDELLRSKDNGGPQSGNEEAEVELKKASDSVRIQIWKEFAKEKIQKIQNRLTNFLSL